MPRSVFLDANREREQQGEAPYSNPRNAASGILRQLDPELASRRGLLVWIYSNQHPQSNSHLMSLADLVEMGLPINPLNQLYWNTQEVQAFHREMLNIRGDLDYEIDGIVVKVDHFSLRETLGANNREPRWATAWKFPPGQNATMLKENPHQPRPLRPADAGGRAGASGTGRGDGGGAPACTTRRTCTGRTSGRKRWSSSNGPEM